MEHLDARLGTIAAMVPRCRAVADIGCDHGLLVAALLEGGRCDYGIAADINPMPLEKARQELTRRELLAQSECRLTNGLCGIAPVGVDAVVVAGMGGELIADILSRWDYTENPAITYLLQPMTRPVHLRRWLYTASLYPAGGALLPGERQAVYGAAGAVHRLRYRGDPGGAVLWGAGPGK